MGIVPVIGPCSPWQTNATIVGSASDGANYNSFRTVPEPRPDLAVATRICHDEHLRSGRLLRCDFQSVILKIVIERNR
jgi:hypothetical protein